MITAVQIIEESDSEVSVIWSDGKETKYGARDLRKACPCAGCIDEWTGKKILKDELIDEDLEFKRIAVVGRYALNFQFTDGHDSGIFSFNFLRQLSEK